MGVQGNSSPGGEWAEMQREGLIGMHQGSVDILYLHSFYEVIYQNPVSNNVVKENEVVKEKERCRITWTTCYKGLVEQAGLVLGRIGLRWERETLRPVGKPQDLGFLPREGSKATGTNQMPGLQFLGNKQAKGKGDGDTHIQ